MSNVIVYDVGGTKIATTLIDQNGNDLLGDQLLVIPTPARADTDVFVDALVGQYEELNDRFGDIIGWGAAFPGPYRQEANGELVVLPRNIPAMRGVNVEARLRERLPHLAGVVDNDMKLALWGEYLSGNARGHQDVLGLVHSTGVSSAIIKDGAIMRGRNNNVGELGCVPVERDPNKARPCDAQDGAISGHLEAQIRGPVLAELFFGVDRHDAVAVRDALEGATDDQCIAMADYIVPYVVDATAPICQVVEPELVLLHGSIGRWLAPWYVPRLEAELRTASEAFAQRNGQVVISANPVLSPLIGAAQLAFAKNGVALTVLSEYLRKTAGADYQ